MIVVALLPSWQRTWAGAFVTGREFMTGLAERGHDVFVGTTWEPTPVPYTDVGVRVMGKDDLPGSGARDAGVVVSNHRDFTVNPRMLRYWPRARHLLMVHGNMGTLGGRIVPDQIWYPSIHCRSWYSRRGGSRFRSFVIPPPINPAAYAVDVDPKYVTVFGGTIAKGVDVVARAAAAMPGERFRIVADNLDYPRHRISDNVEVVQRTGDPRVFYRSMKALLVPSTTETYGRSAEEAALSGIPVIAAAELDGVREAVPDAVFVARADRRGWVEAIKNAQPQPPVVTDYEGRLSRFERAVRRMRR